jgi:hypothetical protein
VAIALPAGFFVGLVTMVPLASWAFRTGCRNGDTRACLGEAFLSDKGNAHRASVYLDACDGSRAASLTPDDRAVVCQAAVLITDDPSVRTRGCRALRSLNPRWAEFRECRAESQGVTPAR